MNALILAAGRGERLRPLTDKIPKPMIEVAGKPVIVQIVEKLRYYGFGRIIVNLHYKPLPIIKALRNFDVEYSTELKPRGTAGALTEFEWDDYLLVINGDTLTELNYLIFYYEGNSKFKVFTHDNAVHNGGVFLIHREIIGLIDRNKPYSIHEDLIPEMQKKGLPIELYKNKDIPYYDIGTPKGLKKARKLWNAI